MHRPDRMFPQAVAASLLAWYDRHRRRLPWRAGPGERPDPYRVWLSEIMLQQTTVAAAGPYFERFLSRWPDLQSLARAPLEDVLVVWAGLGYYARARNLHACAKTLFAHHGGRFPDTAGELQKLPGIGPYTAAAIAAIAFDRREAAIDANAERVLARFFAIDTPLPAAKLEIARKARSLVPQTRPGDFAQALMDLGAAICTPKSPQCGLCPLAANCQASRSGLAGSLPRKAPRRQRPFRYGTAFWVERDDGAVLLRRRPGRGLLGGMMEIPSTRWAAVPPADAEGEAPLAARWNRQSGQIEHSFTHFHLILGIWRALAIDTGELKGEGDYRWVERHRLHEEALPSLMRKIIAAVEPRPSP